MVVLSTNHINKLTTLIEDNPLVKTFSDVELVLTHLYGSSYFSEVSSEIVSPKVQLVGIDTEPTPEVLVVKTYKIDFESQTFSIKVEQFVSGGVGRFLLNFIYEEGSGTYVTTLL
jgi:hypothetical protein